MSSLNIVNIQLTDSHYIPNPIDFLLYLDWRIEQKGKRLHRIFSLMHHMNCRCSHGIKVKGINSPKHHTFACIENLVEKRTHHHKRDERDRMRKTVKSKMTSSSTMAKEMPDVQFIVEAMMIVLHSSIYILAAHQPER